MRRSENSDPRGDSDGGPFGLCGVQVALDHEDLQQAEKLRRLWQELFVVTSQQVNAAPGIRLQWSSALDVPIAGGTQLLCEASGLRVEQLAGGFVLDCGSARLRVDLSSSVGSGYLQESFFRMPPDEQRRFLLLAVVMLIRRHERFAVHAGGVSRAGRGCLIAGRSGSGKTTLGLSLVRQGWSNLSDDVVVLQRCDAGIDALSISRGFCCTQQTVEMFRDILACRSEVGEKWMMQLTGATSKPVTRCRPNLLLFPTIGAASDSRLIPIGPLDAVNELIQFSAGIMMNQSEAARQLQVLNRLVSQSRAFRMIAGRDVIDNPEQVAELIHNAAEA